MSSRAGKNTPQSVLAYIDYHWAKRSRPPKPPQALRLTRDQRRRFFSRDKNVGHPVLAGEGKVPVAAGYVHQLSPRLSFEIIRVHLKRGRWRLEYVIHDDRENPFYLLPTGRSVPLDEKGNVTPMPPEEEIGYSRNPLAPRADRARSVPPDVQNVIDMQAKLHQAERPKSTSELRSQERSVRAELHRAMDGLSPAAQTALLAEIKRQIADAIDQEAQAA